jgi:two-component system chemotaxis response regulator CheY
MARGMIVDDSKFMRKIIREALDSGGHTIISEAENGNEGIEQYKKLKPDFVTMDITMGGKDGIKAVNEIMKFDSSAKIIVVSALSEKTIRMNDNIQISAFITKPFEKENLLSVVKKILGD